MSGTTRCLCLLILVGVGACGERVDPLPVEPGKIVSASEGTSPGAVTERGTGVFTFDGIVWFDCVDEFVHSVVYAPYRFHLVLTPAGEYVYHDHWDTDAVTGTLTGQSSGTVWHRVDNVSPFIERSTGGGMSHYTFKGVFVSDTGPELKVHEVFHVSRNARGEITAEHYRASCRVVG